MNRFIYPFIILVAFTIVSCGRSPKLSHTEKAVQYGDKKDYSRAIKELKRAVKEQPDNIALYRAMSVYYDQWGKFDESDRVLNKAISLAPDDPSNYFQLGISYSTRNDLDSARLWWGRAVDRNPQYFNARYYIDESYLTQAAAANKAARRDEARALFQKADESMKETLELLQSQGEKYASEIARYQKKIKDTRSYSTMNIAP